MDISSAGDSAFLERLLAVIDEGQRRGTHKLLTLLGIIDGLVSELGPGTRHPPTELHLDDLADQVLQILWPQVREYVAPDGASPQVLRQSADTTSKFVQAAQGLRNEADRHGIGALSRVATDLPGAYSHARLMIRSAAVAQPLHRLQYVRGKLRDPFLYEWPWTDARNGPSLAQIEGHCGGLVLKMKPHAAAGLLRFAPLIRPLIESLYVRDVARFNQLNTVEEDLHQWLFGNARARIPPEAHEGLMQLQKGRCFYHPDDPPAASSELHVDHFLPHRRHRLDSMENLVLAHVKCNTSKSDQYAAIDHMERWFTTLDERTQLAARLPTGSEIAAEPDRTRAYARAGYLRLPLATPLWTDPQSEGPELLTEEGQRRILHLLQDDHG